MYRAYSDPDGRRLSAHGRRQSAQRANPQTRKSRNANPSSRQTHTHNIHAPTTRQSHHHIPYRTRSQSQEVSNLTTHNTHAHTHTLHTQHTYTTPSHSRQITRTDTPQARALSIDFLRNHFVGASASVHTGDDAASATTGPSNSTQKGGGGDQLQVLPIGVLKVDLYGSRGRMGVQEGRDKFCREDLRSLRCYPQG